LSLTIISGGTPRRDDGVELTATRAPDSEVSTTSARHAREVVDHRQDADAPAADQRVADEVEAPALVRTLRQRHRRSGAHRSLAATPAPDPQVLLAIQPQQLLVVHD
jgi:hypothetical protein